MSSIAARATATPGQADIILKGQGQHLAAATPLALQVEGSPITYHAISVREDNGDLIGTYGQDLVERLQDHTNYTLVFPQLDLKDNVLWPVIAMPRSGKRNVLPTSQPQQPAPPVSNVNPNKGAVTPPPPQPMPPVPPVAPRVAPVPPPQPPRPPVRPVAAAPAAPAVRLGWFARNRRTVMIGGGAGGGLLLLLLGAGIWWYMLHRLPLPSVSQAALNNTAIPSPDGSVQSYAGKVTPGADATGNDAAHNAGEPPADHDAGPNSNAAPPSTPPGDSGTASSSATPSVDPELARLSVPEVIAKAPSPTAVGQEGTRRLENGRPDDGVLLLESAAAHHDTAAMSRLAKLYDPVGFDTHGPIPEPDIRESARYYRDAVDGGNTAAQAGREQLHTYLQQRADSNDTDAQLALKDFWK